MIQNVKKPLSPTTKEIMEFHAATGCPVNDAKGYFESWEPSLIEKALEAARNAGRLPKLESFTEANSELQIKSLDISKVSSNEQCLVDPVEGDPVLGPIVAKIYGEEEARIRKEHGGDWPRGGFHQIWNMMKKRLAQEHEIEWYSPAELAPWSTFD